MISFSSADLSRLIPTSYSKKGRGRIEKTEIIEMAIKHMKHLQNLACQGDKKDRSKGKASSEKYVFSIFPIIRDAKSGLLELRLVLPGPTPVKLKQEPPLKTFYPFLV